MSNHDNTPEAIPPITFPTPATPEAAGFLHAVGGAVPTSWTSAAHHEIPDNITIETSPDGAEVVLDGLTTEQARCLLESFKEPTVPLSDVVALLRALDVRGGNWIDTCWQCCGEHMHDPHAPDCPLVAFCARHGLSVGEVAP